MRETLRLALPVLLLTACGDEDSTGPSSPSESSIVVQSEVLVACSGGSTFCCVKTHFVNTNAKTVDVSIGWRAFNAQGQQLAEAIDFISGVGAGATVVSESSFFGVRSRRAVRSPVSSARIWTCSRSSHHREGATMTRALLLAIGLLLLGVGCASVAAPTKARYDALRNPRYPGNPTTDLVPYQARDRDGMECVHSPAVQATMERRGDPGGSPGADAQRDGKHAGRLGGVLFVHGLARLAVSGSQGPMRQALVLVLLMLVLPCLCRPPDAGERPARPGAGVDRHDGPGGAGPLGHAPEREPDDDPCRACSRSGVTGRGATWRRSAGPPSVTTGRYVRLLLQNGQVVAIHQDGRQGRISCTDSGWFGRKRPNRKPPLQWRSATNEVPRARRLCDATRAGDHRVPARGRAADEPGLRPSNPHGARSHDERERELHGPRGRDERGARARVARQDGRVRARQGLLSKSAP